ncbi:MAG: Zn(II)2Cys6 transcription factor domain-containing protein, partial [archaeon]|nr:Zn(II)2Cys6 transcription factor domain-containing protein [archaeon]
MSSTSTSSNADCLSIPSTTSTAVSFTTSRRGVKTRTACDTCRETKKKCDGLRPACTRCLTLGQECHMEEVPPPGTGLPMWCCPVVGCSLSYSSRAALNRHVRTKHPLISDPKEVVEIVKRDRYESRVAISVDGSLKEKSVKSRPIKRLRKTLDDVDWYWPCMLPSCLKVYATIDSLKNHLRRTHPLEEGPPPRPVPKGAPHPMAVPHQVPLRILPSSDPRLMLPSIPATHPSPLYPHHHSHH